MLHAKKSQSLKVFKNSIDRGVERYQRNKENPNNDWIYDSTTAHQIEVNKEAVRCFFNIKYFTEILEFSKQKKKERKL